MVLEEKIRNLAATYETPAFIDADPSRFMHQWEDETNQELFGFIAASLSYGSRTQFMQVIDRLLADIHGYADHTAIPRQEAVARWLTDRRYEQLLPDGKRSFYRLYSCSTYKAFLSRLADMVKQYGSIRHYLEQNMNTHEALEAVSHLCQWFRPSPVIPKDTKSACKRLCMFLRWMVRTDSPVDIGIWSDLIDRRTLIIPLDTHVIQEAARLGLITSRTASMSTARRLTDRLLEIFPDDPLRGDFALFGLGVDDNAKP